MPQPPRFEDMPHHVEPADILFELRQFEYRWERWAEQVAPGLAFADKLRLIWSDTLFVLRLLTVPAIVGTLILLFSRA